MAALRARVVRLLWIRAVAVLLALVVLGAAVAVGLDWWLRPSAPLGRWTTTVVLSGWLVAVAGWFLRGIPQRRISTTLVARQLERRLPALGDRLSSAVAMLDSSDARESELRGQVVRQAAEELSVARPEQTIDAAPAVRMAILAGLLVGTAVAAALWRPELAELAARRLFAPASAAAWPRRNYLELANVPERVHAGAEFEVFVQDRGGSLPADTAITVRTSSGERLSPPLRMSGTAGAAKIDGLGEDFAIRATGGDDDTMPWRSVRVVAAPQITSYELRLVPPEYSGRPPRTLVGERFRILAGTRLSIEAEVEPPVVEARFERVGGSRAPADGAPSERGTTAGAASEEPGVWTAELGEAGNRLAVGPIVLDRGGQFVFRWTDREGLSGESRKRWRIEVEEDAVPRVALVQPAEDRELTAEGSIELEMLAEDDLGLAESWFQVQTGGTSLRFQPERLEGTPREHTRRTRVHVAALLEPTEAPAAGLEVGQTIELTGVALDTAGQRGESTTRRLRIVSTETLRQSLAADQRAALEPLREAAREQKVAAEQTEAARGRLLGDDDQRAAAEDRLRAAEAAQAAAERRVAAGPESALERLREAVRKAEDNDIEAAGLRELLSALESAAEDRMQPAGAQLETAREQLAAEEDQAAAQSMEDAIANQRQAAETLDEVVATMRRDDARRAASETLAELQADQERLREASQQVADAVDARREASRLAQQQRRLAREAEAMRERLQQLAEELGEQNPQAAAAAEQAAERLQPEAGDQQPPSSSVADAMRAAAAELERGREGRASQLQQQIADQLAAAERELRGESGSPQSAETESEDPLQNFAAGLETLRSEQASLVAALREELDPTLAAAQDALADESETLAATPAAPPGYPEAVTDVASEMRVAAALLRRRGSEAAAVERAESALTRLEFIAESLRGSPTPPSDASPASEAAEQTDAESREEQNPPVPLSTLRLVRATQEFLRARTEQLAAAEQAATEQAADEQAADEPAVREPAAEALRRARFAAAKRALAEEQQRLIERIERYAQAMAATQAETNETEESDAPAEN